MKQLFKAFSITCLLLLMPFLSFANDWYQVEVIAFAYVNPNEDQIELWDNHPGEPDWKKGLFLTDEATAKARRKEELAKAAVDAGPVVVGPPTRANLPSGPEPLPYVALPSSQFTLQSVAAKLSRKDAYRLLSHSAWRQPATSKKGSESVRIFGGEPLDSPDPSNPRFEFDGLVTLKATKYLHVDVDAVLRESSSGSADYGMIDSAGEERSPLAGNQVFRLTQSQRVRSNKLYYFDHPLMGVIVKVSPYGS